MSRLDGAGGSSAILIRHFLQVPWPPQVESMAMPFQLAASNRVTPYGTRTARSLKTRLTRTGWVTSSSAVVTWLPGPAPALLAASAAFWAARCAAIQLAPHSSRFSTRSAALTARTICGARASMIALVSPG